MTRLWEDDPRERIYAPWRNDPRPIGAVVQGLYAYFGMTALWRALANPNDRRSAFEFAYHRAVAWHAVNAIQSDPALTETGRRFVDAIADVMEPWQREPVAADLVEAARRTAIDHHLGWRIRHVRPQSSLVTDLSEAWLDGRSPIGKRFGDDQGPTPIPDENWSHARADLTRLAITKDSAALRESVDTVPGATLSDLALVTGRFTDAVRGYQAELAENPDRPASLAGLTLALSGLGTSPATRTLLYRPELVRAVHRHIRRYTSNVPSIERLADWIGRSVR